MERSSSGKAQVSHLGNLIDSTAFQHNKKGIWVEGGNEMSIWFRVICVLDPYQPSKKHISQTDQCGDKAQKNIWTGDERDTKVFR